MDCTDMSWDSCLPEFANLLIPSEDYVKNGHMAIQSVVEFFKKQQTKYAIDRVYIAGNIGTDVSLVDSDFDCILVINGISSPPHGEILTFFEAILKSEIERKFGKSLNISKLYDITTTEFSLQFQLDDQFDVDLFVAGNYIPKQEVQGLNGAEMIELQKSKVLERISKDPETFYGYKTALAASQIEFMKKQNSVTHSLVRICKYWLKGLNIGECPPGVKAAIVVIAVSAAQGRTAAAAAANDNQSIKILFNTFLKRVISIDKIKIAFDSNGKVCRGNIHKDVVNRCDQLGEEFIRNILLKKCFILDPSNHWNDLAENISPEIRGKLKQSARLTLRSLDDA